MPEREPRSPRTKPDRRLEIVKAAVACMRDKGYARLTARSIAERAGLSPGHITYHFKDMKEVMAEAYRHASDQLLQASTLDDLPADATAIDRLRVFLGAGFSPEFLAPDYLRLRIDLWSAAQADAEIAQTDRALYDRYRAVLAGLLEQAAVERGGGAANLSLVCDTVMATLDGLWLDWSRRRDPAAIRRGLDGCMVLVKAVVDQSATGRD